LAERLRLEKSTVSRLVKMLEHPSRRARDRTPGTKRSAHTEPEVPTGSTSRSSAEPFREFIHGELEKGRDAKAIFQSTLR
jgi:hypothetical protein